MNGSGRGPPGRESARRWVAEERRERSRSRAPELRAPRHAPGQPRLQQVPARLRGDGQRPRRPTRGSAAPRAFSTGSGTAPHCLPLHVPGPPGAGTGPGGLQHRSVSVLSNAGEWLTSLPDSLREGGGLSLVLGLGSLDLAYSGRERDLIPRKEGNLGTSSRAHVPSAQCAEAELLWFWLRMGLNFPPRRSIGRSPHVPQVIARFLSTVNFSLGVKNQLQLV